MSAARIALAAASFVLVLTLVPVALAGKPGGGSTGGGSSLSLVMVNDVTGNGLSYGDTVTFSVSTTATGQPEVKTACSQSGAQVYYHEGGFYPGDPWAPGDQMFVLKSYSWAGGAASCTATLFYMNRKLQEVDLTSLSFQVGA